MSVDIVVRRIELYQANQQAMEGQMPFNLSKKLDSSLKKNTSFIKKIKGINSDTVSVILTEISALTLEKYLSEVTASLAEGLLKLSKNDDINAALTVVCALYQRFTIQFLAPLLSHLVNGVVEKSDLSPSLKQKTGLKILFELQLLGIGSLFSECLPEILSETASRFYTKLGSSVICIVLLKDLMSYKTDLGYALPAIATFLRRFSIYIQGENELLHEQIQQTMGQLFKVYTTRILETRQALYVKLGKLEVNNKKASIRTGKIMAEHQELVDETTELKELFDTNAALICDFLNMELPSLKEAEKPEPEKEQAPEENKRTWWQDSKERVFYQEVPSYKDIVEQFDTNKLPRKEYEALSEGQKVNLFLAQLEELIDAKDLDLMTAIMHTYITYNKATRHRVIRFFTEVKKVDNINLYARFLRINADFFPEVISELIETLDRGFRSQIHFDTINFRNLAFFIELVKFRLIPSHVVFHKIRRMTLTIAGTNNVDILLVFYERCGKFLLFEPEYLETTREMLDLLQVQAKSDRLSINEKLSLSNMFLIVDSFTASAPKKAPKHEMSVLQDYIHQCIKKVVSPTKYHVALELLSVIDFSLNTEAQNALIDLYVKPEDLGGDRFKPLSELLLNIGKTHRHVVIIIVEILTEKIIRGLELNNYRQNISRMAQVKMLGAFFNAKILSFKSIVDLLYKIVCFGYPNNLPTPNAHLEMDPRDNYFRIQLVCVLLKSISLLRVKTSGLLNLGVKTVEGFLVFLQYYTFCKTMPLPKDIEFSLAGVLASFNQASKVKMQKSPDLVSAMQSLQQYTIQSKQEEAKLQNQQDLAVTKDLDIDSCDSDLSGNELSDSEDEDLDSDSDLPAIGNSSDEESAQSEEEGEQSLDASEDLSLGSELDSDYEDEDEVEEAQQAFQLHVTPDRKETQRMDDEINYLLSASMHQARVSAPLKMPAPSSLAATSPAEKEPAPKFRFLTKSNNLRDLSLPSDNRFTERIALEQAAQKANRQKIMSLVDNMYES